MRNITICVTIVEADVQEITAEFVRRAAVAVAELEKWLERNAARLIDDEAHRLR